MDDVSCKQNIQAAKIIMEVASESTKSCEIFSPQKIHGIIIPLYNPYLSDIHLKTYTVT